jgi:hypothetical protein
MTLKNNEYIVSINDRKIRIVWSNNENLKIFSLKYPRYGYINSYKDNAGFLYTYRIAKNQYIPKKFKF